jgi:hypothetical protein
MKRDEFKNFVKSIILEVKKDKKEAPKSDADKKGSKSYLDNEKSKYRKDVNNDPADTVQKLVASIRAIVNKIGKKIEVVLDDHNDIMVRQKGVFYIRVSPKWSGIFDVEAYRNMSDRIYAVALTNDQVLDFIKVNFSEKKPSYVQAAYDKSMNHLKDASDKKAKELPKGETVKHIDVPAKDIEDAVTDKNDLPDAPMATVKEKDMERQEDHGVEKNKEMPKVQKMIKKEVDDDLTKNWKK